MSLDPGRTSHNRFLDDDELMALRVKNRQARTTLGGPVLEILLTEVTLARRLLRQGDDLGDDYMAGIYLNEIGA